MSTKKIRFLKNCGNYNGGEVARFDEKSAGEYVKRGVAMYLTADVSSSPVTKKEPAPDPVVVEDEKIETEKPEKPKKKLLRRRPSRRRSTEE